MPQAMIDLLSGKIADIIVTLKGLMLTTPQPQRQELIDAIKTLQYVQQEISDSNPDNVLIDGV